MTLHAAKGLEFEAVFLAGMEDGTLPYERPWSDQTPTERDEAQDEERRLCYVGMTRAKARLTLSLARRRMSYGEAGPSYRQTEPSRFLRDLPPELFGEAVAREVRTREARAAQPFQARPPLVRRHPGALEGEPHIELDGEDGSAATSRPPLDPGAGPAQPGRSRGGRLDPTIDYDFDQRPDRGAAPFQRGERVRHPSLGEGIVLSCEGAGMDAKATVRFDAGDKRIICRFLSPAE